MAGPKNKRRPDREAPSRLAAADSPSAGEQLAHVILEFLGTRLDHGSRLCVALSGGRDSLVLLHALHRLSVAGSIAAELSAIHVHHGLSPNADAWATFCTDFCERCAIPLRIARVEVPRNGREGLEGAARRARHDVFAGCDADWLALAHHRDDQAETVLLNLLRGAGIAGAAGMLSERPQPSGPALIRPLLDVSRRRIEAYADEQGLVWIDDESNEQTHFRRNFLRREIVPRLEGKFPGARKSLARAGGHFAEASELLDDLARLDRAVLRAPWGRIAIAGFNALSVARARNLLRFVWAESGFRAPDARWLDEALQQLAIAGPQAGTCISTVDGELRVYRGELYIVGHNRHTDESAKPWNGEAELTWAGGELGFVPVTGGGIGRKHLPTGAAIIRRRQGGERLQPDARRPRRSLRNLLQEAGIPPWERARLPYLWIADQLVWVAGIGIDSAFACAAGEPGVQPVWAER